MISHERPEGPLVRILLDTNVFVSAFIFGSASLLDYIDDLVDQKNHGFIELVVPKAVQMELYAILRSGRVDFGQAFIEGRMRHPVTELGIQGDLFDFPIMATALLFGVDLIVTSNMKDFIDPLGKMRVMNPNEARNFDHYSLHLPYDFFYDE